MSKTLVGLDQQTISDFKETFVSICGEGSSVIEVSSATRSDMHALLKEADSEAAREFLKRTKKSRHRIKLEP